MKKIINIFFLFSIFMITHASAGTGSDNVYLVLVWNQDSHDYSGVRIGTGTIDCLYNACAALKYYPGVHAAFNPPQSLIKELESFDVVTDTSSIPVERRGRIKELISTYKSFQDRGIIEISMMALFKPVLPLIYASSTGQKSMPGMVLPDTEFSFPQDARALVFKGMAFYNRYFDKYPAGLFPVEGSMSQEVAEIVSGAGLKWVITGESLLSRSVGNEAHQDSEDSIEQIINPTIKPEILYKPYFLTEKNTAVFFSSKELSDGIADASKRAAARADWLIKRIYSIKRKWKGEGTPVVTVVLDSYKIWKDVDAAQMFIARLYRKLASDSVIKTVTPAEWLDIYFNSMYEDEIPASDRIEELFPGTWTGSGFESWMGEEEENRAWSYLALTRKVLETYKNSGAAEIEKLDRAFSNIYKAQGGDWFWWYGDDHDSGRDKEYDRLFRFMLIDTYKYIGEEPPAEFYLPIVSRITVSGVREAEGSFTPVIDGVVFEGEWDNAGCYIDFEEGKLFDKLYYGYDKYHLYLRLDTRQDLSTQEGSDLFAAFYIGSPGSEVNNVYTRFGERSFKKSLKYGLSNEVAVWFEKSEKAVLSSASGDNEWQSVTGIYNIGFKDNVLEVAVPLKYLNVSSGDEIMVSAVASRGKKEFDVIPAQGPVGVKLEDIMVVSEIIRADDPLGDSNGPGWFTYPESPLFDKDFFDFMSFAVKEDADNIILEVRLRQIENTLDSPLGLGPQLIDIYIDLNNRLGAGSTQLLEGRNAYTVAKDAWEWVVTVNGWSQELYKTGPDKPVKVADLEAEVANRTVKINIPKGLIRGEPENWGFIPVMFAQDCSGYSDGILPAEDAGRASGIEISNDEYHFGGGIEGVTDTNVLDVILPKGGCQSCILKVYKKGNAVQLPAVRKLSK